VARLIERIARVVGVVALGAWAILWVAGRVAARDELARFSAAEQEPMQPAAVPDFLDWSVKRITAWRAAQTERGPAALGVLRIRRLRIEAPILPGTDDWTLDRGLGHIVETAPPGATGNSGIAGHRDGFFRVLKDIATGDAIEVVTPASVVIYRVERTWIVMPEDVWVLDPTPSPAVTLVTCYPFYFIGSAPQRFIVRAVHETTTPRGRESTS
jgi:sortase A